MKFLLTLLSPLLMDCTHVSQPEHFILPQGEVMECLEYAQAECGMNLFHCGSEHSVDFECMTGDVIYKGRSPALPPAPIHPHEPAPSTD